MASTQIPMYKLEELADEMIKPLYAEKNKLIMEFEKAVLDLVIKQTPADVLKLYNDEKTKHFVSTRESMYYNYHASEDKNKRSIYVYFRNDKGEKVSAPFQHIHDTLNDFINSLNDDVITQEFIDRANKIHEHQNEIARTVSKITCALKTCNTPTKLKNEMPLAYKLYMEKIEKTEPCKENGCDVAEEINTMMHKYHK